MHSESKTDAQVTPTLYTIDGMRVTDWLSTSEIVSLKSAEKQMTKAVHNGTKTSSIPRDLYKVNKRKLKLDVEILILNWIELRLGMQFRILTPTIERRQPIISSQFKYKASTIISIEHMSIWPLDGTFEWRAWVMTHVQQKLDLDILALDFIAIVIWLLQLNSYNACVFSFEPRKINLF